MKLLTPTEVRTSNQSEVNKNLVRVGVIRDALQEVERKLNDSEARFDATLARQRAVWEAEKAKHIQEISDLESEINTLKKQREVHLIPIELERKKAHDLLVEADEALSESKHRQEHIAQLEELLQEKLDDLSDREADIRARESEIKNSLQVIGEQKTAVTRLSQELTHKWEEYFAEVHTWNEKTADCKRQLDIREINLTAREGRIAERELAIMDMERAVRDKYQTLLKTEKRLNK